MIKELYQWIKLFFWLKKEKNRMSYYHFFQTYSNEFIDSIRSSVGYNDEIEVLWTLIDNLLIRIDQYHRWHNQNRTEDFKPLRLDISKDEVDNCNAKGFGMTLEEYQKMMKEHLEK